MTPRVTVHLIVGILIGLALVLFATLLQTRGSSALGPMLSAQRGAPLLWVVDACAIALPVGMVWAARQIDQFQRFVDRQADQHYEQLTDMIERANELERINDSYSDRIEGLEAELARQFRDLADQVATLEEAADHRQKQLEIELRRASDHANSLLWAQLDRNSNQVDLIYTALQFQRSELRRLRQEVRDLQLEVAPTQALRLRPAASLELEPELTALPASTLPAHNGSAFAAEPGLAPTREPGA
jgi:hypothetical protein